ncbi:hypothetical protein SASPL_134494 [Salvia splendens]|uniref:Uncharacterized protein n=1 Tax=Salvia splendens TaxID=180675 RepID=A0A4D8ZLI7_SALSN|nr:hypothetical protein SASPL_156678 [Salvia splendens]KAG6406880.1 hypothetical protein SASPL_134494 [Salvia splendens]
MTKVTSLTPFFFLLCFSCIISLCLSRPISNAAAGNFGEEHWFLHPWLFAHAPMPNGGFKWPMPVKHWPFYAQSPMPSGGFKWPVPVKPWPFYAQGPTPSGVFKWPVPVKHWPFYAQGPIPDEGWKWWPKKEVTSDDTEEVATAAAPPLTG